MTFPTVTKHIVSRSTLERSLPRALLFLRGVGSSPSIRRDLEKGGYTGDDHDTGWRLLRAACGDAAAAPDVADNPLVMAEKQLDDWLDPALARARAVLRHLYPDVEPILFSDLPERRTGDATLSAALFVQRWKALQEDPRFEGAVGALAKRGFTEEEQRRIAALIKLATADATPASNDTASRGPAADDLARLHAWLVDWTDTALALVHRKADLIRLGISRRRPRASKPAFRAQLIVE